MLDISAGARLTAGRTSDSASMLATMPIASGRGGWVRAPGTRWVCIHNTASTVNGRPMWIKDSSENSRSLTWELAMKFRVIEPPITGSARTPEEHLLYREQIGLGFPLEHAPDESLVLDIQAALWNSGLVRSAGAVDILIAGYAIVNDATVLTADHDFDHIASVSDLRHEYVAPSP